MLWYYNKISISYGRIELINQNKNEFYCIIRTVYVNILQALFYTILASVLYLKYRYTFYQEIFILKGSNFKMLRGTDESRS